MLVEQPCDEVRSDAHQCNGETKAQNQYARMLASGAGNFFTVMAYGDNGQTANRVFSNPQVTTCGAPR